MGSDLVINLTKSTKSDASVFQKELNTKQKKGQSIVDSAGCKTEEDEKTELLRLKVLTALDEFLDELEDEDEDTLVDDEDYEVVDEWSQSFNEANFITDASSPSDTNDYQIVDEWTMEQSYSSTEDCSNNKGSSTCDKNAKSLTVILPKNCNKSTEQSAPKEKKEIDMPSLSVKNEKTLTVKLPNKIQETRKRKMQEISKSRENVDLNSVERNNHKRIVY